MKDIVIIGAGGFGREVAWLIEDINTQKQTWNIVGFIDEDETLLGKKINGYKVVGNLDWLVKQNIHACIAIGNPKIKEKIVNKLKSSKVIYPNLIHPSVIKSKYIDYGEGCVICAGCILTVNIKLGNHIIINLDTTVGHDAIIKDYTTILPSVNISGFVKLEKSIIVGTGTQIIEGIQVAENAIIGASASVVRNIVESGTYVGVPAKRLIK